MYGSTLSVCFVYHSFSSFWLFCLGSFYCWGFPGGSMVKNLPADLEDAGWSLNWEDPLEKETATPSSILAWEIPRTEEPGGLQYVVLQRVRHSWATKKQDFIVSWNPVRPFFNNFSPVFFFWRVSSLFHNYYGNSL